MIKKKKCSPRRVLPEHDSDMRKLICVDCGNSGDHPFCIHRNKWHAAYGDCGITCAHGLGWSNLGKQHWGCCFSTDKHSLCPKSAHVYGSAHVCASPELPEDSEVSAGMLVGGRFLHESDCPRYRVNLDEAPEQRWDAVITAHLHQLPAVIDIIDDVLGTGFVSNAASVAFNGLTKIGKVHFGAELDGIARAANIPVGKIALMQIAYEIFAACTSIVVDMDGRELGFEAGEKVPYHIRTMDWPLTQLQALTCEIDFVSGGRILYTATTWPGYVGVMTGVKPGAFSVSVNYRRTDRGSQDMLKEVLRNMMHGLASSWPVSFLVREALEQSASYVEAVHALQMSSLMAPTYITIAGTMPGEGIVITRTREGGREDIPLWSLLHNGPIVQPNRDWFADDAEILAAVGSARGSDENICHSVERSALGRAAIASLRDEVTPRDLWLLMSTSPCRAPDTIYTTAMCPRSGELLTRAWVTREHETSGKRRWGALAKKALNGALDGFSFPSTLEQSAPLVARR